MQTVGQQLGQPQLSVFDPSPALIASDAIGVELELEGFTDRAIETAQRIVGNVWRIDRDGSLRNGGVEFITNGGLGGRALDDAFTRMQRVLDEVDFMDTFRCSTHMHINMRDFTVNQVVRFVLLYTAAEPVMFAFCGDYRYSSNFCTPVAESIPFHKRLLSMMTHQAVANRAPARYCNKYTALNITPLFPDERNGRALGTVEFRGSRALTNRQEMLQLSNLLLSIKQYVRTFEGDEEAMLNSVSNTLVGTLFAPELVSNLNITEEQRERAMVNAWLLLKSYQQGLNRPEDSDVQEAPHRVSATLNVYAAAYNNAVNGSPSEEEFNRTVMRLGPDWEHLAGLRNSMMGRRGRHNVIDTMQSVLRSVNRDSTLGSMRAVLLEEVAGYVSDFSQRRHTTYYLDSLLSANTNLRMRAASGHAPNSKNIHPRMKIDAHNLGAASYMDYTGALPQCETLDGIKLTLFGRTSRVSNLDWWFALADTTVRVKNREAIEERLRMANINRPVREVEKAGVLYGMLQNLGLHYKNHVWRSDCGKFLAIAKVINKLGADGVLIPKADERDEITFVTRQELWWRLSMSEAGEAGYRTLRDWALGVDSQLQRINNELNLMNDGTPKIMKI